MVVAAVRLASFSRVVDSWYVCQLEQCKSAVCSAGRLLASVSFLEK